MSATLRQRIILGVFGVCAVGFITTESVQAQKIIIKGGIGVAPGGPGVKDKEEPRTDEFGFIIDDKKAPKIVESVLKHLKPELSAEDWKDIINNLQTLLDDPTDKLVEWTDPVTRKTNKESIRKVANKLIGRFSKQGREFYQSELGPTADQRLKDAIERADYRLMNEVSLRYFHTKAGAEATVLIGRHHLDRGRYSTAAETFRRFMERNQDDPVPINVNFLTAVAWKRLAFLAASRNEKEDEKLYQKYANEFWEKVVKEAGGKAEIPFPTNARTVKFAQLEDEFKRVPKLDVVLGQFEWQGPRGNPQNNAQGVGSRPFLDKSWDFSLMPILDKEDEEKKGNGMKWIEQNLKQFIGLIEARPNQTSIPAFFPVASAGKIIFRTYDGVYCLATRDDPQQNPPVKAGDMLWMVECEHSLYKMVEQGGQRNQMETQWLTFYRQQGPLGVFFENGLLGSLSHDGTLVYFVDDIAVPPHPQMQMQYGGGFGGPGQPQIYGQFFQDMVFHNKLYAYNLETGKIVWKAGGRNANKRAPAPGEDEKETAQTLLADAYFLGAPLPLRGKLYVVVEKDRELRLVCLDPSKVDPATRHPELVWSQPLGSPNVAMPQDTLRRIQGINLAYSDNVLVVPTNAGAVLGIDLLSHSIVWARSYRLAQNVNVGDPNLPIGGRIRPPFPNQGMNQNLTADRWRASTPIISAGKVVFTAYDANSIMCLSLRDGEILWEATRAASDLYVAGVFDNKVLVVGKDQVKFLDLNKGTQVGVAQTGTPSGVGTASNDIYFLPTKPDRNNPEPEILSIDIKEMKVIAHTRSRKKVPTGNLVFFDNGVFSQTPHSLTAFPQLSVKIAEAEKRLAANPNDPIGLAEMGDLKLDNGELDKAIENFNKCLANNPSKETRAKAREKLYDAVTELLQRDFTGGEKLLKQYEELCSVEIPDGADALVRQRLADEQLRRKSNYFCLVAKGKEGQGKLVEAFDNYMNFGRLTENRELISVIDQPNTMARPDVWARGRINHMLAKATPEQRKPLEERAMKEWEDLKKSGDVEKIRSFVRVFGTAFAAGNEARLLLAEKLIATNNEDDLRDAEHVLLGLKSVEDVNYAARGTEALARLYIRKGLLDDAMGLYDELNRLYPKVVVRDQKTGADLFNELITDKRFLPYLEPHRQTWLHSKLKAQEINQPSNQQMQQFTITPDGESIPFFNRHKVVVDMQYQGSNMWTLKVIDRITGEERFRSQALQAPTYIYNLYPPTNNHQFAKIKGHMLLLNLNHMVYAFDLADRKKLWEYNLLGKTPIPNIFPTPVNTQDGVRLNFQDGWSMRPGQIGVIESSYVCLITRDGLVAVDPARGNVLWTKSNVSAHVELMGDDNYVFVFESNADGGVTSARAVRASDGVEVQIQDSAQVFSNLKKSKTAGRRVLVLDEKSEKKAMRLYDILTGKDDWKKEIEGDALLLRCEDPNLTGYVSKDKGEVSIFSVKDGKEIFTGKLDAKKLAQQMDKVEAGILLVDRDRFFIVLNRAIDNNARVNNMLSVTPGMRTMHVNGTIYCFDRTTKKRLWFTDEQFEHQQIILEQFQDLPVVLGAHYYNRINNGVFEGNHFKVVALDKQTGRTLYRKEVSPQGQFHALVADPKTGVIDLIRYDLRIRFSPDDKPSSSLPDVPVGMGPATTPPQIGIGGPVQAPIQVELKILPPLPGK